MPPHIVQRPGNLAERAHLDGFHKFGKYVASGQGRFLETLQGRRGRLPMALFESFKARQLRLFFLSLKNDQAVYSIGQPA